MFGAWFGRWFGEWFGNGEPVEHSTLLRIALTGTEYNRRLAFEGATSSVALDAVKHSRTVSLDGVLSSPALGGTLIRRDTGN